MAINPKSLKNLKPLKKGQVLNPDGARTHNKALQEVRRLTKEELAEVGSLIIRHNIDELRAIAKNPKTTVLKAMCAALAIRVISRGDPSAYDALLNRLVGKVPEKINMTGATGPQVTITLPSNGREAPATTITTTGRALTDTDEKA